MTLLVTGLQIYYVCKVKEYASEEDDDTKLQLWYILEFAGAGIAALLWVIANLSGCGIHCLVMMVAFNDKDCTSERMAH